MSRPRRLLPRQQFRLAPEAAWTSLNEKLFGDHEIGGHDCAVRPEMLPVDWSAIFGRTAPLAIEIGSNRGRFIGGLAARDPDRDFVGIEVRKRYARSSMEALTSSARNVRFIWADAKLVAPAIFARASLAAIYLNFPDPWWKRRHVKRRIVERAFSAAIADLLACGGRLWVKTDVAAVGESIREALACEPRFGPPTPFCADDLPPSHRELDCIAKDLPVDRFWCELRGG